MPVMRMTLTVPPPARVALSAVPAILYPWRPSKGAGRALRRGWGGWTMRVSWQGVFPALMTEFTADGALDLPATQRHAEACIEAGCTGLIMLGTLGENCSLAPEEKEQVLRAAV